MAKSDNCRKIAITLIDLVGSSATRIEGKIFDDPRSEPDAYLVPLAGAGARLSKPLESADGLFRDFAQLEKNETAIRTFANAYGLLGAGGGLVSLVKAPPFAVSSVATYTRIGQKQKQSFKIVPRAESWAFWTNQINAMHRVVELWDAVRSLAPQRDLRRFVEWPDEASVRYHSGSKARSDWMEEWIAANTHHPELLAKLQYPDLVQPAWHQLQRLVNRHLAEFASCPQLEWDNGNLYVFIQPRSLIGAMWLQFALAVDGDRKYRVCPGCGRWFEVGGGQRRTDAETCSVTCRQRRKRNLERSKRKKRGGK
jgi:hypothetical protein